MNFKRCWVHNQLPSKRSTFISLKWWVFSGKFVHATLRIHWLNRKWWETFVNGVLGLCIGFIDKSSRVSHRSSDSLTLWTNDSSCGMYSVWYEARCWQVSTVNKYVHLHTPWFKDETCANGLLEANVMVPKETQFLCFQTWRSKFHSNCNVSISPVTAAGAQVMSRNSYVTGYWKQNIKPSGNNSLCSQSRKHQNCNMFCVMSFSNCVFIELSWFSVTYSLQVLQFIIGHVDVFSSILRDRQTDLSLPALQELAITTSVLSRCAAHGNWKMHP